MSFTPGPEAAVLREGLGVPLRSSSQLDMEAMWRLNEQKEGGTRAPLGEWSQFIRIFSFQRKWYGFNLCLSM